MIDSNPHSYHGTVLVMEFDKRTGNYEEILTLGLPLIEKYPDEEFLYHYTAYAALLLKKQSLAGKLIEAGLKKFPESSLLIKFKNSMNSQAV